MKEKTIFFDFVNRASEQKKVAKLALAGAAIVGAMTASGSSESIVRANDVTRINVVEHSAHEISAKQPKANKFV